MERARRGGSRTPLKIEIGPREDMRVFLELSTRVDSWGYLSKDGFWSVDRAQRGGSETPLKLRIS